MTKFITLTIFFSVTLYAHSGHVHKAPWEACDEKEKEDICSYTVNDIDLYRGTCQYFNTVFRCVRNKPIIKELK